MSTGSVGKMIRTALRTANSPWGSSIATSSYFSAKAAPAPRRAVLADCTCHTRRYSSYPSAPAPAAPSHPGGAALPARKKRTILDLHSNKRKGIPITMLTAHDYPSARFLESCGAAPPHSPDSPPTTLAAAKAAAVLRGVDICLVGDSLAMVACGYASTTSLGLDELLYHCRSVARGCHSSLLVADMPFGTFTGSTDSGVANAVRIIQEGNMDAVKIEGGVEVVDLVTRLTSVGIPVMGHVGLTPQRQSALSGFRVQGKTAESAMRVWTDAQAIEKAGAFAIVLEAVPSRLAAFISKRLTVPTIGIGAGVDCGGQVLVQLDMLGVSSLGKGPKFLKKYVNWEEQATSAIGRYVEDVREGAFPEEKHGYPMGDVEWEGFLAAVDGEAVVI